MSVEIFIRKVLLDGGGVRFDLMGKSLSEKFLGMAADLKFRGVGVKYEKMEWGNAFSGFEAEELPVKMVKSVLNGVDDNRVIFGISLKSDNLKALHDGVIGSFYFTGEGAADLQFVGFENAVLSNYQNGRVDVTDVKWLNGGQIKLPTEISYTDSISVLEFGLEPIQIPAKVILSKVPLTVETAKKFDNKPAVSKRFTVYPNDMPDLNVFESAVINQDSIGKSQNNWLEDSQFIWWFGSCLIGLIILLLLSVLYVRRKLKNKTWQYKLV